MVVGGQIDTIAEYFNNMDVSANIKAVRATKGLAQAEVARRLELDASAYHRLENRGSKLSIEQAESIAQALGVGLLELLTWGSEPVATTDSSDDVARLKNELAKLERTVTAYEQYSESATVLREAIEDEAGNLIDQIGIELGYGKKVDVPIRYERKGQEKTDSYYNVEFDNEDYYKIFDYLFYENLDLFMLLETLVTYQVFGKDSPYRVAFNRVRDSLKPKGKRYKRSKPANE